MEAKDLKDIELRRLFEPTPTELRADRSGRIFIHEGLSELDVERAMRDEFDRIDSVMFIRVKRAPRHEEAQSGKPEGAGTETPTDSIDDGC